jgi:predicted trehalose synthase
MKAQVHGDLHGDQGFIRSSGDRRKIDEFLDLVQKGTDSEIQTLASQLAANICWSDFEGPPAKTLVQRDYDARDILLADLGGMIQGFWYMLNVILYENHEIHEMHENREIYETQREISLSLGGVYSGDESGLCADLIRVLNLWLRDITDAFINGYFDETEARNTQSAILKEWNRGTAAELIRYQILARAIHELRYETYSRNWGWEAIPGTRILNLSV